MATGVRLDLSEWSRAIQRLVRESPPAMVRAMNRSIKSAEVVMVRAVAADLGIKQADVRADGTKARSSVVIEQATLSKMAAAVVATGRRISLSKFGAKQTATGVTARMPGGRQSYPGLFVATMRSGHRGVFGRKAPSTHRSPGGWTNNLPIVERHGASVPHVFDKHVAEGQARGLEQLGKNVNHEIVRLTT